jgi:hypothetical protein
MVDAQAGKAQGGRLVIHAEQPSGLWVKLWLYCRTGIGGLQGELRGVGYVLWFLLFQSK